MNRRAALIVLTVLLTSCGLMKRTKSQFFSIDRVAPASPVASIGGMPVGIDVVELPPGFDRREILVRKDDNGLEVRETHQWTASMESLVLHTMAFNLAGRLPDGMVILPGQPVPNGPMRGIDLVFEELVAGPGNEIHLDVRWTLREANARQFTEHEEFTVAISSLDSEEIARGMSAALGQLADRIVARLR